MGTLIDDVAGALNNPRSSDVMQGYRCETNIILLKVLNKPHLPCPDMALYQMLCKSFNVKTIKGE